MARNSFLHIITITTIALSVFITSAFILCLVNGQTFMTSCKQGFHMMAYIKPHVKAADTSSISDVIQSIAGIDHVKFISKTDALEWLKKRMNRQAGLFEGLTTNPLPDAFKVHIPENVRNDEAMERIAREIEALPSIENVEYARKWIKRFVHVVELIRFAGIALGALFFLAAVLIVANTIRLLLYSKKREIEIMRLVGATDFFIKTPFFIQSMIQSVAGSLIGLFGLYSIYGYISARVPRDVSTELIQLHFLSLHHTVLIALIFMGAGCLGCGLSLKQFSKS